MRSFILALIMICPVAGSSPTVVAATFSSTNTETRIKMSRLRLRTELRRPDTNAVLNSYTTSSDTITSGTNLVDLTVDTTADTVRYNDIDFLGISMPERTQTFSSGVNYDVLVTPANFPNPAAFKNVSGIYTSRITFNSFSLTGPSLLASATSAISYPPTATSFALRSDVTMSIPQLTVTGTYEAIGPTSSASAPISLTLTPTPIVRPATSTTQGGPGFGDGFPFTPLDLSVVYVPTSSTLLVNLLVDEVRFTVSRPSLLLPFFQIPEPSSLGLAALATSLGIGRRRR